MSPLNRWFQAYSYFTVVIQTQELQARDKAMSPRTPSGWPGWWGGGGAHRRLCCLVIPRAWLLAFQLPPHSIPGNRCDQKELIPEWEVRVGGSPGPQKQEQPRGAGECGVGHVLPGAFTTAGSLFRDLVLERTEGWGHNRKVFEKRFASEKAFPSQRRRFQIGLFRATCPFNISSPGLSMLHIPNTSRWPAGRWGAGIWS